MGSALKFKIYFGIAVSVSILLSLGFFTYRSNSNAIAYSVNVAKTNAVLYQIQHLLTTILDIETGERGYNLTKDKRFLDPKEKGLERLDHHLNTLAILIKDNKKQVEKFNSLKRYLRSKINFTNKVLQNTKHEGLENIDELEFALEGKFVMDQIRKQAFLMELEEKENLQIAKRAFDKASSEFKIVYVFLLISSLIIISILSLIINKSFVALQKASSEIYSLYNNASYGYFNINSSLKIINVNDTVLKWTGYSREEFLDGHYSKFLIPANPTELEEIGIKFNKQGWLNGISYYFICKDKSLFPAIFNAVAIKDNMGNLEQIISTCFDNKEAIISELKIQKLNEELEHSVSRLQLVNKELEAFTYSVSHDLRAPLRSIVGYTTILQSDYKDHIDEEGLRIMNIVVRNAKKMGLLIDDLLAFSHLGKKELSKTKVNMRQLIDTTISEIATDKNFTNVHFSINEIPYASADMSLLRQVWFNLISNAVKYSSKSTTSEILIEGEEHPDENIYSIQDNGVGFDMTYVHKLFGVFQRLHKQQEFEGTGVGLAIVQRIIYKHGGRVWAESEVKKGAKFYFSIPNNNYNG